MFYAFGSSDTASRLPYGAAERTGFFYYFYLEQLKPIGLSGRGGVGGWVGGHALILTSAFSICQEQVTDYPPKKYKNTEGQK